MKLSDLKRNSALIAEGQWVGGIPNMGDLRLRVRGISSPTVAAARARKERAVPRKERDRDGSLKHATSMRITGEILHEVILIDWEGVLDDKGKPLPFDAELAAKLCTDPDWIEFANAVAWAANVVDNGGDVEEIAGN